MQVMKKTIGKTGTKTNPATRKTKKASKGDKYVCNDCGLVVSVDTVCGCIDTCNIVCCDKPMKIKKNTTKKK
jgi:hypothetical protein